jgi:hypothetical protein
MKKYLSIFRLVSASIVLQFVLILFSGCVRLSDPYSGHYKTLDDRLDNVALKSLFDEIAHEFCTISCSDCVAACTKTIEPPEQSKLPSDVNQLFSDQETVIITDFVDLQSFEPKRAGLLMAELMRGSLSKVCCNRIIQGEFSKFFKLSEKGLVVLTRSVGDLKKDNYPGHHVVVGTYEYKRNKLMIFIKKINIANGKIIRMVTREIDFVRDASGDTSYQIK